MNASELVKEKYLEREIYMSSTSDPYQPLEEDLKLTRMILDNLDKRERLSIQTKSDLVLET